MMPKVYMWQNTLCSTYLMIFKKFEDFFRANNWEVVPDPVKADWIVIGACGSFIPVISDYVDKVKALAPLGKKMVIYGCLPKITPEWYKESTPKAALYIPTEHPEKIEEVIHNPAVCWSDMPEPDGFRRQDYRMYDPARRYVVTQYGCNAKCVYCPHVIGIGPQVSRPRQEILAQIEILVDGGAHTIFLEGRDAGSWGTDLNPPETYLDLLIPILEMPGDFNVYINQFGANWVLHYGQELLEPFCHPRITDIHIAIETTSPRLLELMGRDPRVNEIGPFLRTLRKRKKTLMLRTDLLIGFPTETEEELLKTLEFVREHFDEVACHGFELHPHTPVMDMGLPFYDDSLIEQRVQYAIKFLEEGSQIITHRGGQVIETMIEREKRRAEWLAHRKKA